MAVLINTIWHQPWRRLLVIVPMHLWGYILKGWKQRLIHHCGIVYRQFLMLIILLPIHGLVHIIIVIARILFNHLLLVLIIVNARSHFQRPRTTFSPRQLLIVLTFGKVQGWVQIFFENAWKIAVLTCLLSQDVFFCLLLILVAACMMLHIILTYDTLLDVETETGWGHVGVGVEAFARASISHTSIPAGRHHFPIHSKGSHANNHTTTTIGVNLRCCLEQNWRILESWRLWRVHYGGICIWWVTFVLFCRILFDLSGE